MTGYYHADPAVLHVGCEKPRAYFIPFEAGDDRSRRENSSRFLPLDGDWNFRWYANVYEIDFDAPDFPFGVSFDDVMPVPYCWQVRSPGKYDAPNYINQDYPFPVDPPELGDEIPCGLYARSFRASKKEGRRYYLNFEGVSSCFYLWLNGSFLAYSEVSHCTSEVDCTGALRDGENDVRVLVVKHCTGSYFEDQDFFRLSGIFRDVYLLERDARHITDVFIRNYVSEDLGSARLVCDFTGVEGLSVRCELTDPAGNAVFSGSAAESLEIGVESPVLWDPERPNLYRLTVYCGDEIIDFDTGLRRFEIKDSAVLLNGVGVKARGVNRHDTSARTGYAVTEEEMLADLVMMRRAGVNMIRTSHYPNDPRFPAMCDRLGFMLVDEADLETHGMGYNYGDWYWDYWAHLCDSPEWLGACLDRAERLFERDKNHSCVVLWSLGNESGCGENHRKMAAYIRSRDDRALIHYENARLEYEDRVGGRDFKDISDVESRMYAPVSYLREYLADPSMKKPFFYCEYVCSMSTGDVYRHWDGVEESDKYFGGCIWEWKDHAVNIGSDESPRYRFGGDFGDEPNDGWSCADGLVFPDGTPRPGYYDMRQVYRPLRATYSGGTLTISNRRFYTSLADCRVKVETEINGVPVAREYIERPDIPPLRGREYPLALPEYDPVNDTVTVNVYLYTAEETWFAPADFELGCEQIIVCEKRRRPTLACASPVAMSEDRTGYTVRSAGVTYRLSKITGLVVSMEKGGREYLVSPLDFSVYRSVNYNNRGDDDVWKRARFDRCRRHSLRVFVQGATDNMVSVRADISFAAAAMPPAVKAQVSYVFTSEGLYVAVKCDVGERVPELPRFGLRLDAPEEFDRLSYFGYGPQETYSDRFRAGRLSRFAATVDDNFVHYIKPQECGSHYSVREASVKDASGAGLEFFAEASEEFCFNAGRYTDIQLRDTLHDDELEKQPFTRVSLDYKIAASSRGDEGEEPARRFEEKLFYFNYRIKVV